MEDFVTFEIAKKLKEKGFIGNGDIGCCCGFYCEEGFSINIVYDDLDNSELLHNEYLRPSISQVLKWLREKSIFILPELGCVSNNKQYFQVKVIVRNGYRLQRTLDNDGEDYTTYEESALAGIEYVLDKLNLSENNNEL